MEIVRKDIKNLHLGVYPPNGRVRVAAPRRINDEAVRLAVVTRLGWIRRQQARFDRQERRSEREVVSGETHYVNGRRYRLRMLEVPGVSSVRIRNNCWLELTVPPGTNRYRRQFVLDQWHRERLRTRVGKLVEKWSLRVGVSTPEFGIRKMKTRWGSCNAGTKRIWINLELAGKPVACLEYIVVHELVHLLHRNHNDLFREQMDRVMPSWRTRRDQLNSLPLPHQNWHY